CATPALYNLPRGVYYFAIHPAIPPAVAHSSRSGPCGRGAIRPVRRHVYLHHVRRGQFHAQQVALLRQGRPAQPEAPDRLDRARVNSISPSLITPVKRNTDSLISFPFCSRATISNEILSPSIVPFRIGVVP